MSKRTSFTTRSAAGHRHCPAPSSIAPPAIAPRPNTPTRFNSPRKRQLQQPMPSEPSSDAQSGSTTPNSRRRNNARKRGGESRKVLQPESPDTPVASEPDTPDGDTDSDELFQLLGVNGEDNSDAVSASAPPVQKGLLRLSKEGMDAALGNNLAKKKRVRTKNKPRGDATADQKDDMSVSNNRVNGSDLADESPTANRTSRRKRGKGGNVQDASREESPQALDLSDMSRSLPASFFAESKPKDPYAASSEAWDMPADAPHGGQPLNWQQQLQAEDTPKRGNRSNPSDRRRSHKASPIAARNHDRHQSLDQVPISNLTKMMAMSASPPTAARAPGSAFDVSIPFHTGFNVHRAPQTPVRSAGLAGHSSAPGTISLPIVGEFPRINKSGAPLGGPKYAGPTFHNSPASGSLPKPDLDDF